MPTFLTSAIFTDMVLPFVLIFALTFAILEKSKLLGDGKSQINAIIGFVVAAIFISFANVIQMIQQLTVFMALALVVLLVLMLVYSFASGDKSGAPFGENIKMFVGTVIFISVIIAVLVITGYWQKAYDFFIFSQMGINLLVIILIGALIYFVLQGAGKEK